jgi:hypothetical protein
MNHCFFSSLVAPLLVASEMVRHVNEWTLLHSLHEVETNTIDKFQTIKEERFKARH